MDKIQRMWKVTLWEKVFVKNERNDLSDLRKISNAVWEKAMMRAMCGVKMIEKRSQEL